MVLGVDVISCSSRCLPPGPDSLGLPEALQSHHTVFGSAAQKSPLPTPRTAPYPQDKPPLPWRRAWLPTPVFLPEKCHGQRSLAGYSP